MEILLISISLSVLALIIGFIIGRVLSLFFKEEETKESNSYNEFLDELEKNYYNSPYKSRYKNYYDN